jgi:transketolase
VDKNGWQAMGRTEDVMRMGDLEKKFDAFGFETMRCPGHDEASLDASLASLVGSRLDRPKALICQTEKGHGVSFMAGDNAWHHSRLTPESFDQAMSELGP